MPDQILISLIISLPILAFICCQLLNNTLKYLAGWLFLFCTSLGLLASLFLYYNNSKAPEKVLEILWFSVGQKHFIINVLLNAYTYLMLILVYFISLMVGLFSMEYMRHDKAKHRYFSFIGLFIFSMIGVVLSGNLFLMYFFWEIVGFCSYLLIGFWYDNPHAVNASLKAFLVNRVGDICFLIGIFMCYLQFGTTNFQELVLISPNLTQHNTIIGLLLFGGCVAKSAQFPLHTWLPDAMEGPTPVSALIHAATMVAAGIYLLIRIFPLFTPDALIIIAFIGLISLLMGGVKAVFQSDIKKVLAYSTISQLGLMVLAVGIGKPDFAFFHLLTHAFFKAGLFLCAGSVIHAIHYASHDSDAQNMYLMGGLKKRLPITFWCYLICSAALAALPFFTGFLSKDQIIEAAYHFDGFGGRILLIGLFVSSFLTAFYMGRQLLLVFGGEFRNNKINLENISEKSWFLFIPIIILAILSTQLLSIFIAVPHFSINLLAIIGSALAISGLFTAFYFKNQLIDFPVYTSKVDLFYNKFIVKATNDISEWVSYFDKKIIDGFTKLTVLLTIKSANVTAFTDMNIVDGLANGFARFSNKIGKTAQNIQSGQLQWYVSIMMLILLLIFTFWGSFFN
jgi:NADH-quinone oxidoreductase subunit L